MSRTSRGLLGLVCCVCAVLLSAGAQAAVFDAKTMLDSRQITRGMRAVGKSVFAGATITSFNLEIIDVMHKANSGGDMILARVLDGPVVKRQSGIIGGMSGSPVTINGKLIGAIAYGWGFMREPICGITPIRDMLEALDIVNTPAPQEGALPRTSGERWASATPLTVGGRTYRAAQVVAPGGQCAPDTIPLRLVGPIICASGLGPQAMAMLQGKLKPFGLEAVTTGGAPAKPAQLSLQPGAALGVRLMEGDFDITGIGTVTYRQGNRLLGFGHPMMQRGRVAMPICTAWIHDFLPNMMRSNKLGSGVADLGTLQADTAWAVGGQVGPLPTLRPASIEILDRTRNLRKQFHVKVLNEPGLTSALMVSGIASALEASYNPGFEGMISTHFEVTGTRGARVSRSNQFYISDSPLDAAVGEVSDVMRLLEDNRWEPQDVASLSFRAELSGRDETAFIEKLSTEETVAKAGKPLHLHVRVRPDNGAPRDYPFTIELPRDLPKGSLRIAAVSGNDAYVIRDRLGILLPDFDNLSSLLSFYEKLETNRQLCLLVAMPQSGLRVGTTRLYRLPVSLSGLVEKSPRTDVDKGREEVALTQDLPWVVFGREMMALATEDRQGGKGTVTATAPKPTEPEKTPAPEEKAGFNPPADRLWWAASAFGPVRTPLQANQPQDNRPTPLDPANRTTWVKKEAPPSAPGARNPIKSTDEDEEEEPGEEEAAKSVLRQPTVWTQAKLSDFTSGDTKGTTLQSDGGIGLAPLATPLGDTPEPYVMAVAAGKDCSYVGTANPGRVYRIGADSKPTLLYDTGCFGVRALALDAKGNLYVGAFPDGKVFRVTADGKGALYCQLPVQYVWALTVDAAGRLLAGTGPGGKLYALDDKGQASELTSVPQTHILALLARADGLYLGTGARGLVYRLLPDRRLETLYDAGDQDVTSLAAEATGPVYAGCAPEGKVIRLSADATPTTVFEEKSRPVHALACLHGEVYAATAAEGQILRLLGDGQYQIAYDSEATHGLCLAVTPDGALICGAANPGQLLRLSPAAATAGQFTSAVLDAGRAAQWGLLDWLAEAPEGSGLVVRTRSGNSNDPDDDTWSPWSGGYQNPGLDRITSPPARYLQYRLELTKAPGDGAPFLRRLCLCYLPANQRPEVKFDDLAPDKVFEGELEVKWTASDPDKDQLTAVLEVRPAGGEWRKLADLGADKKSYKWDTAKEKDGKYDLRVMVSDEAANPGAGLNATAYAYSLLVDNTAPTVTLTLVAAQEGRLVIQGKAADNTRVVEVAYKRGEQWYGVAPADGAYDSREETFTCSVPLVDNAAEVDLQVRDAAGNTKHQKVVWPAPADGGQPTKDGPG